MTSEELTFVKHFNVEVATEAEQECYFELRSKMSRKEVYDILDIEHLKAAFLLGALIFDEVTDCGCKPLTAETVKNLDPIELESLVVFAMEMHGTAAIGELTETLNAVLGRPELPDQFELLEKQYHEKETV